MKKPMSEMTAHEFVYAVRALAPNYSAMAEMLGKSRASISKYTSADGFIPSEVAARVSELLRNRSRQLGQMADKAHDAIDVEDLLYKPRPPATKGRLMRRQHEPDTSLLPMFKQSRQQNAILLRQLSAWAKHLRETYHTSADEGQRRDIQLELADIKSLAETWPRGTLQKGAAYGLHIQVSEWQAVGRALRFGNTPDGRALYQTMRRFFLRGGYDRRRFPLPRKKDAADTQA